MSRRRRLWFRVSKCANLERDTQHTDVDGDEGNLSVDSSWVVGKSGTVSGDVGLVKTDGDTNDGNDDLADSHTGSTTDQKRTTTDSLHGDEWDGSEDSVDQVEDEGDEESVLDGASRLEERCGVVEDEVDT
jgi:hypothetical protein